MDLFVYAVSAPELEVLAFLAGWSMGVVVAAALALVVKP